MIIGPPICRMHAMTHGMRPITQIRTQLVTAKINIFIIDDDLTSLLTRHIMLIGSDLRRRTRTRASSRIEAANAQTAAISLARSDVIRSDSMSSGREHDIIVIIIIICDLQLIDVVIVVEIQHNVIIICCCCSCSFGSIVVCIVVVQIGNVECTHGIARCRDIPFTSNLNAAHITGNVKIVRFIYIFFFFFFGGFGIKCTPFFLLLCVERLYGLERHVGGIHHIQIILIRSPNIHIHIRASSIAKARAVIVVVGICIEPFFTHVLIEQLHINREDASRHGGCGVHRFVEFSEISYIESSTIVASHGVVCDCIGGCVGVREGHLDFDHGLIAVVH
mmetsp:Transcript_25572/g.39604  ORF Transcript_25572/g.39604 Transcript_25572/m.39604 type:complete len:334 (-) Transcript_25572:40-1041(-)